MIERHEWHDVMFEELIDDAIVEIDAFLIGRAVAVGNHAWPRERDARGIEPELRHHRDIVAIAMVEIARHIAGIAVFDFVRCVREAVPNRLALAVLIPSALDLSGGAGGAPEKVLRKGNRSHQAFISAPARDGNGNWHCGFVSWSSGKGSVQTPLLVGRVDGTVVRLLLLSGLSQLIEDRTRPPLLNEIGSIASIVALVITVATFYQARQSKRAAEQARDRVLELNAVVGIDAAIKVLEEIRRLHRLEAWTALPDRYTSLMMDLRAIRTRTPNLSPQHQKEIQKVVAQLTVMERQIEQIINRKAVAEVVSLNEVVTRQINRLADLLVELETLMQGRS